MSELETKRNSIMNAIASGQLTNLLANCTWLDGYFGRNTIETPTSNKEKYCEEYIEVQPNHRYLLINKTSGVNPFWCRYLIYNSSQTYIDLQTLTAPNDTRQNFQMWECNTTGGAYYIRVSQRTFGDIDVALVDMDEVEQWLDSKISYENVTEN